MSLNSSANRNFLYLFVCLYLSKDQKINKLYIFLSLPIL